MIYEAIPSGILTHSGQCTHTYAGTLTNLSIPAVLTEELTQTHLSLDCWLCNSYLPLLSSSLFKNLSWGFLSSHYVFFYYLKPASLFLSLISSLLLACQQSPITVSQKHTKCLHKHAVCKRKKALLGNAALARVYLCACAHMGMTVCVGG